MILLASLLLFGCVTTQAPQGVDNSIFSQTKKRTAKAVFDDSNKSQSFVEGPAMLIDENPYNRYSLIKFKSVDGEIRYRLIYQYAGIWVASAVEKNTDSPLNTDLLSQSDINGYVLETGAVDLERILIDECLDSGMQIVLQSKGSGTVFTPTPEMIKAMNREDWDAIKKMQANGEGYNSKYENKTANIIISPVYLKAFIAKSDMIDL
jgi:hypothetical protein